LLRNGVQSKYLTGLSEDQNVAISYETIYQHIGSDKISGGYLFQHLRGKGKGKIYQSRSKNK
jgi:IS30 family transposase